MGGGGVVRYLLFVFSYNYPSGGWGDFKGAYPTIPDAEKAADGFPEHFDGEGGAEVVDSESRQVVSHADLRRVPVPRHLTSQPIEYANQAVWHTGTR